MRVERLESVNGVDKKILVSVIVPVCNVQRFLRQCLDSLTEQTMQNIQIICIDDGSTDDSLSILEEYASRDDRIEVITKPNAGYGHTMNRGLEAAKGEYVGIVESDDVAEPTMFEELYKLASQHNADVVKSNFFPYQTDTFTDIDDPKENNLGACEYGKVFNPLEEQNIFLTQPAIWSALYRREFLVDEGISFLETPGASFQDTSFNFKALAAAKRVFLTPDAFLHYRIDNAGSSVKSLSKVFCICDEYRNIWDFAKSHQHVYDQLKYRIPQIQFGGYIWNLERLTPALQYEFYQKFVEAFQQFEMDGLLKEEFFDEQVWATLQGMLRDPRGYFESHYGPIEVERTVLLMFENDSLPRASKIVESAMKVIGRNDEVYLQFASEELSNRKDIIALVEEEPRFHFAEGEINSSIIDSVDISAVRGKDLVVVEVNDPAPTSKKAAQLGNDLECVLRSGAPIVNETWAMGLWSVEKLQELELPIWPALLFGGLYNNEVVKCQLPGWLLFEGKGGIPVRLPDFLESYEAFKTLYAKFVASVQDPTIRHDNHCFFSPLWKRIENSFHAMRYEERCKCGFRPSVNHLNPWLIVNGESLTKASLLTVIVPVYNVRPYIKQCLESIFAQQIDDVRVVCVDDGSTDGSLDLLLDEALKDDRLVVISQLNGGAGAARNRALEVINSEYVAFIDPDDTYVDNQALSKLLNAAQSNNAKLCGGSFVMELPDGSERKYFGGRQAFYTLRKEGVQSLSGLQTDYGWIRFLYHHSIFDEGKVCFPERRWYEDPVFLVRVMQYCDEFYGIKDPIYCYTAEYKEPSWNVVKVRDILTGILENMEFAQSKELKNFYTALMLRLNVDYYPAIMEYFKDEEVFTKLAVVQGNLDHQFVNDIQDAKMETYLIKPFMDSLLPSPLAVVRAAERFGKSSVYKKIQSFKRRLE